MSWYELVDILARNRDEYRAWQNEPPQACPNDGQPLMTDPDGNLRCQSDGWTWDGTSEGKRGSA